MISYRKASEEDAQEIKDLLYSSWTNTYTDTFTQDEINKITSKWHAVEFLIGQMHSQDGFFLVAENANSIIGMCNGTYKEADWSLNINKIHVLPNFHGQGVGTEMMKQAIALYPELKKVTLEVEVKNVQAIGFYEKQGFKETGKTEFTVEGITIPCLIMEKSI